jgi:hypothetical protein
MLSSGDSPNIGVVGTGSISVQSTGRSMDDNHRLMNPIGWKG